MKQAADPEEGKRIIARNPRARHDYHILETWEAGLVLTGTEVKSLRNGEVFLEAMNVTPYEQGNRYNHDPVRSRKLLLHRKEIGRLIGAVEQKGLALVPLEVYFRKGKAKVVIALGRGKKEHDRREDLKRRIADREVARAIRGRGVR
jgi:SsrA-binding protein